MPLPPKTPPRFVPTLTEVVQVPGVVPGVASDPTAARIADTSSMHHPRAPVVQPPSVRQGMVPPATGASPVRPLTPSLAAPAAALPAGASRTLSPSASMRAGTQQVQPAPVAKPPPSPSVLSTVRASSEGLEEYMVHRVMQRVDVVLDQRLRDAIATVVQEQTRSVLPRLREEIESVVRNAVYEAVAEELASGTTPPSGR